MHCPSALIEHLPRSTEKYELGGNGDGDGEGSGNGDGEGSGNGDGVCNAREEECDEENGRGVNTRENTSHISRDSYRVGLPPPQLLTKHDFGSLDSSQPGPPHILHW
eukprot:6187536-Pleurochrysis_carterae.AAC.1